MSVEFERKLRLLVWPIQCQSCTIVENKFRNTSLMGPQVEILLAGLRNSGRTRELQRLCVEEWLCQSLEKPNLEAVHRAVKSKSEYVTIKAHFILARARNKFDQLQ